MFHLPVSQQSVAQALYRAHGAFFPLIATVLLGEQNGEVLVNQPEHPTRIYVEHAFGFAQVFGAPSTPFDQCLERHLLLERRFTAAKVRLYTPHCPGFLQDENHAGLRAWRQHFELDLSNLANAAPASGTDLTCVHVSVEHLPSIEAAFPGVITRFWRTADDFLHRSLAVIVLMDNTPAALCYAAAVADGKAEIDVMTLPDHRLRGLAKEAVHTFNRRCLSQGILPLWDCFTNNSASMALCRALGFKPLGSPYPFFTINR